MFEADGTAVTDVDDGLVTVFQLLRAGRAHTRPELADKANLGRSVVSRHLDYLLARGLLSTGGLAPSTGGRSPRYIAFRADAGALLVAELGASGMSVGLSDLTGALLDKREEPVDIAEGPEVVLERVRDLFDGLLRGNKIEVRHLWGIGLGVPGPVEFSSGRAISPPIMPGWNAYPIRSHLNDLYKVPVWVDNDVNLLALGEYRAGLARGEDNCIYVKIGTGIGAGIICRGQLHRGAKGCAGDIGHVAVASQEQVVCRCGYQNCLEALAGGFALARDGNKAAADGTSAYLASILNDGRPITGEDITAGAERGDPICLRLLQRSGRLLGEALATVVNFFNPSLILVGGGVARAGDSLLSAIRLGIYRRSLPLATRDLRILMASPGDDAGLRGAAIMVMDELFDVPRLSRWLHRGSPVGMPDLVSV